MVTSVASAGRSRSPSTAAMTFGLTATNTTSASAAAAISVVVSAQYGSTASRALVSRSHATTLWVPVRSRPLIRALPM